jgi:hypothetical protein
MSGVARRRVRLIGAVLLAVTAGLFATTSSQAAGGPKTYTSATTTPSLEFGGQTIDVTLTNTSRNNTFNGARITVPAALNADATSVTKSSPSGTVEFVNGAIQGLSLSVGPNTSVTFTIHVTVPQTACASYTFPSDVRQNNDFNGTLNVFNLQGEAVTMSAPCSAATVECKKGDGKPCATGTIASPNGNTASVVVNDGDGITATLTASLSAGALTCAEYSATSDQLIFDIDVTEGSVVGVTKTVAFTQPTDPAKSEAWEYQVCFQAPYDFPALLPSQAVEDLNNDDYTGNTQVGGTAPNHTYTGLLLPCSAGKGVPCVASRLIGGADVTITVDVPALDPGMRF